MPGEQLGNTDSAQDLLSVIIRQRTRQTHITLYQDFLDSPYLPTSQSVALLSLISRL